ncbi:hypothetical protein, partial [Candidatus Thiosymbion oneisti]|uniref:hypothetical protein n=1 Tax=Candidatus Thiosymbion oneisti TaxID=589554 RepID=UPI001FB12B25
FHQLLTNPAEKLDFSRSPPDATRQEDIEQLTAFALINRLRLNNSSRLKTFSYSASREAPMSGVASPLRHKTMTSLDAPVPRHAPTKTSVSTGMGKISNKVGYLFYSMSPTTIRGFMAAKVPPER